MSYTTDRYGLENVCLNDLSLNSCGITTNHPSHTSGKRIYQEYSLAFIIKGEGAYMVNGKTHHLKIGEGFLIIPGILNEYIGDKINPWEYIYVTFTGAGADKLLKDMGLSVDNLTFSFPQEMIPDLLLMHKSGKNKALKGYGIMGQFLLIISRLVSKTAPATWSPENYIKKAKRFIFDNYSYDINVESVAFAIGIDRTYLYRLFMKHENTTPSKYILNLRLEEASKKLRETDAPITEIALSSGFNDVPHFYKAFCNKFKISPKKYREENQ
jgi:AraC-like DNA-binding protein